MIITKEILKEITVNGALNKEQVKYLGGAYPLEKGWVKSLVGREMFNFMYNELIEMKLKKSESLHYERNKAEILVKRLGGTINWNKKPPSTGKSN